jgi:hypothetical protein
MTSGDKEYIKYELSASEVRTESTGNQTALIAMRNFISL